MASYFDDSAEVFPLIEAMLGFSRKRINSARKQV